MSGTTDFDSWLAANDPKGFESIYNLHRTVLDRRSYGGWEVTTKDAKTFIKGCDETLQLLSEKARFAFLARIDDLKDDPELTMEGWYEFNRAMAKDD
jgi:hypothetical protein